MWHAGTGGSVGVEGSGVVMDLIDQSNWGKSPAPTSFTASLNIPHPSSIILWPPATVLTAGIDVLFFNFDPFDIMK